MLRGSTRKCVGISAVVFTMLVIITATTFGSALTETIAQGQIDWEAGVVRVSGFGVPPAGMTGPQAKLLAQRAARADAQRNTLEVLVGVRVSSSTQVRDFAIQSDSINSSVEGMVSGAVFESVECDLALTCEATLVAPLDGQMGLANALAATVRQQALAGGAISYSTGVATSISVIEPAAGSAGAISPNDPLTPVSGIVIDARGLNVLPAMFPQVFDTQGKSVYNPVKVDPDVAAKTTMVAYARSIDNACKLTRVGSNPIIVKAVSVLKAPQGKATDIALDMASASAVRRADEQGALLAQAAVAIIID